MTQSSVHQAAAVEVLETSITTLAVDAITNAANTQLRNVGGVALAIVNAGGQDASGRSTLIQDECDKLMSQRNHQPLAIGDAVATGAGRLPCRWVIHAATMALGTGSSVAYIGLATRNSLRCAESLGVKSLGFVAFGTGVGGVAPADAAPAMVDAVRVHLQNGSALERVVFTIHNDPAALTAFQAAVRTDFPVAAGP